MEPDKQNNGPGPVVIDRPGIGDKQDEKIEHPKMWAVILLNDDYTPYFVVVDVIRAVFGFERGEAERRMRAAHTTGRCHMGVFTKEVAEMKKQQVSEEARKQGDFPLQAEIEEAPSP